jgi:hypothetical protein
LLVVDVFMVGYLAGPRAGAIVYNAGHSLVWPMLLILLGVPAMVPDGTVAPLAVRLGLIWAAHIGMDRAFGFGYKYPTAFGDTDIGRA